MKDSHQISNLAEQFQQLQKDNFIKKSDLIQILESNNYTKEQQEQILINISNDEISKNYNQFQDILGINENIQIILDDDQKIESSSSIQKNESILTTEKIQEIFDEFKITLKQQNLEKTKEIINQYKNIDLVNKIDPSQRQISTYIAVQGPDESIALQTISLLHDYGANFNYKDQLGQSILFYLCRDGRLSILDFVLSNSSININDQDVYGQTPLFYAARENKQEIVGRLIQYNVDVNIVDSLSSQTALFYAAREGHLEICKLLIDNGCNPSHQDSQKKTALFFARKYNKKDVVELLTNNINKNRENDFKNNLLNDNSKELTTKQGQKRKFKELPKQAYKLIFTDDSGNQKELNSYEFTQFQQDFPEVANLIVNAEELIDESILNSMKEEDTWERIARKVLGILWKAKGAHLFHAPVDEKKYGITDYYEIVTKPIDFGTIKNKLNSNVYSNCKEFCDDIYQVFENCILYNGSTNEVGQIGLNIKAEFENQLELTGLRKYL